MSLDLHREITLLASAARVATTNSADQNLHGVNVNMRGVMVIVDVTASADTPSITPIIQGKDPASGDYFNLLSASAALTGAATALYLVYPGVGTASAGITQVAGFVLPSTWRVSVTHADGDSITYSVGAMLLP